MCFWRKCLFFSEMILMQYFIRYNPSIARNTACDRESFNSMRGSLINKYVAAQYGFLKTRTFWWLASPQLPPLTKSCCFQMLVQKCINFSTLVAINYIIYKVKTNINNVTKPIFHYEFICNKCFSKFQHYCVFLFKFNFLSPRGKTTSSN